MPRKLTLQPIEPFHGPKELLRMGSAELKAAADGRNKLATLAKAEIARRAANKAAKKANASLLGK